MNTGSSSHNVPHDPPGCSAEMSIEQSTGAAGSFALAATGWASHLSPAPSTRARRKAHRTLYVVSVRGQFPRSTRFQRSGEESNASARRTIAASNGPTSTFVAGTAFVVICPRATAATISSFASITAQTNRLTIGILLVSGRADEG